MWISGHLPTQKLVFSLGDYFIPCRTGSSLEACKENTSQYQFSETANISDKIVRRLEGNSSYLLAGQKDCKHDSNILGIWFETSVLNTVFYREFNSAENTLYYSEDTIITIQFMVTVLVSSTFQSSVSKLVLPEND